MRKPSLLASASVVVASVLSILLLAIHPAPTSAFDTTRFAVVDTAYAIPTTGSVLYVSPTGNDANAGTSPTAPLRTPLAAVTRVAAGGTIVFRAGVYYNVDMGKVTKPIRLQPYPHEKAYILGSQPITTGWIADSPGVWRHAWSFTLPVVTCPTGVVDPAYPNACKPEQVFVDGVALTQVASKAAAANGAKFFADRTNSLLYVGTNPVGRLVEVSTKTQALQLDPGADASMVRGLCFAQYGSFWSNVNAALVSVAPGVRIESCLFVQNAGGGLAVHRPNQVILSNYIAYNGYRGVNANQAHGSQIVGNTVDRNNEEHFNIGTATTSCGAYCTVAGIKAAHSDNLIVSLNYFRDNFGTGFWCDLGCTDTQITKNVASGNAKHGIYFEVSSRAIIASNIIAKNLECGLKISGSDQVRVYNNDFVGNTYALGLYDDTRVPSSTTDNYSFQQGLTWNTAATLIRNNLFSNGRIAGGAHLHSSASTQRTSPQMVGAMDHNGWYRAAASVPTTTARWCTSTTSCVNHANHAAFVAATALDPVPPSIVVDNIATNPFFVNEAAGDYNLRSDSAAQSAGAALPADIAAALGVPASPVDMGALSWRGQTAPPTGGPQTLTFTPTADATIAEATPDTTAGTAADLIADNDPRTDFLLKFTVTGVGATRAVTGAQLTLTATDPGAAGAKVYQAQHTNFDQTVTWNSAPWVLSPELATLPAIVAGSAYSVDVGAAVTADGTYAFRVLQPSVEGIRFSATEGAAPPRLTLTVQ
jgi:poly(beta-D-mannuronate) C5 epimerase